MKILKSLICSLLLASLMVLTGCEEDYGKTVFNSYMPIFKPVVIKVYDPEGNDLLMENTPNNILHRLTEKQKEGLFSNIGAKEESTLTNWERTIRKWLKDKDQDIGPYICVFTINIDFPNNVDECFYLGWRPLKIHIESTLVGEVGKIGSERGVAKFYFDDKLVAEHRDDDVLIVPITIDWYDAEY